MGSDRKRTDDRTAIVDEGRDPPVTSGRNVWRRIRDGGGDCAPPSPDEDAVPETWEDKGDVLLSAGKEEEALDCYTEGLTEDPSDVELWMKKADVFLSRDRYRSGLFCVDQALRRDMSRPEVWLMRGLLLNRAGDHEGAIESLDYSLYLKRDNAVAWAAKGQGLMEEGDLEAARSCLGYASDIDPDSGSVMALADEISRRAGGPSECPLCGDEVGEAGCEKCRASTAIEDSRLVIARARREGRDVQEAEELLDEAKMFLEKDMYDTALRVLRPIEKLVGDAWVPGAYMRSLTDEAEEIALSLEADDMRGTQQIRARIEKARSAQEDGRPLEAVEDARAALDLANKIAKKFSSILLEEPEERMRRRKRIDSEGPVCPECGEEVEEGWVKCPVCKTPLEGLGGGGRQPQVVEETVDGTGDGGPGAGADRTGDGRFCPGCGEEVEDFWNKCLFCGAQLSEGEDG